MQVIPVDNQVERHVETIKETHIVKARVPSAQSAIRPKNVLDEATVKGLDKSAKFLYNLLTTLEGTIQIETNGLFQLNDEGKIWVMKEDIIDVFNDDMLSVTMMQCFCM